MQEEYFLNGKKVLTYAKIFDILDTLLTLNIYTVREQNDGERRGKSGNLKTLKNFSKTLKKLLTSKFFNDII